MASSDEEGEIVPNCVTNYHFVNSNNTLISFSALPLHWSDHEDVIHTGDVCVAFLLGKSDGGLRSVYKEVIGWRLDLSSAVPEVYMLSKGKTWINLQQPRKSYECIIQSVLIVARCLHFAKRNILAARKEILSHLQKTLSSYDLVESLEKCLSAHLPLIRSVVAKDKDLAKSQYIKSFLMEIENPGRRETVHEENQATNESKFIVSDEDDENDDEQEELFDSVCALCDNGGDILPCEGQCMRSFHPTVEAGVDTYCESLGFKNAAQYEEVATFLCDNCKHQKHQCFACGLLGSSDKSSSPEVFSCVSATCGHFYHPECVANLLHPTDGTLASQLISQIAEGKSFTCPIHKCHRCQEGEDRDNPELQFAVCRRCPKAYHRGCLPKKIVFKGSDDGTIHQRAWDDLLPKRILMYCMKHTITAGIWTPKRDHILFPSIVRENNQKCSRTEIVSERRSNAFGTFRVIDTESMPKVVERLFKTATYCDTALEKGISTTMYKKTSSSQDKSIPRNLERPTNSEDKKSIPRNLERPTNSEDKKSLPRNLEQNSNFVRSKLPYKQSTSKRMKMMETTTTPKVDTELKTRISKLVKDCASSFDSEEYIKEKTRRCTHEIYSPQHGLDKTITMGKVEASVKAVKAALKKLEDGGCVEDAKAVCEPNILNQLTRWKKKLSVFLSPFLIGTRYTSFGRHFTKVDKLKQIVNRLHWYVEDGDTIVDFCCGSNDFSCLVKEKLDSMGKKCTYKNYDLITPRNTFNFEKRDWFKVPVGALPDGSGLVMGLNPPFGVQASLANKFINHAMKFKPKLLILIVPEETQRLDHKRSPYDLIWEERDMLTGKSFYIPGVVDKSDQPLDDWNINPPPLSLWSRPDWTTRHIEVAKKHGHVEQMQTTPHQEAERVVSNYLMEETQDCFRDFSNIMPHDLDITTLLDGIPDEEPDATQPALDDDAADMDLSSPVIPNSSRAEPMRLDPLCIQTGPPPGFSTPCYANTSDPYGPGVGIGYPQVGHYTNYDYPGSTSNYGQPNYVQPDFTTEGYIWPPGTIPPDHRYI